jgi:hypothetical protein
LGVVKKRENIKTLTMVALLVISLIVGMSYVLIGILVKKCPAIIAGYDQLDEYQKKTFPTFLLKTLVTTGIITVAGCIIPALLDWHTGVVILLILPSLIMLVFILLKGKRKKITMTLIFFFVLLMIGIPLFIIISSREHSIFFEDENIRITGLYGETIPIKNVKNVEILKDIPTIQLRTNGLALGAVRKGYFLMKDLGTVKLFLSSSSQPYVKLQIDSDQYIIFNFGYYSVSYLSRQLRFSKRHRHPVCF